jgi:hypothetical protein
MSPLDSAKIAVLMRQGYQCSVRGTCTDQKFGEVWLSGLRGMGVWMVSPSLQSSCRWADNQTPCRISASQLT